MSLRILVVLTAVAGLASVPAFAQSGAGATSGSANPASIGQTLQQDLTKAGFTDVKVMPEAFIVHAKDSHGNPVLMRVGPDSLTEIDAIPAGTKGGAPGTPPAGSTTK